MLDNNLIWKYLGLDCGKPRLDFINDCLFRITQPNLLNDPYEARPRVVLEPFSKEDWEREHQEVKNGKNPTGDVLTDERTEEALLCTYLASGFGGNHFPKQFPVTLSSLRNEPFTSMDEIETFKASLVLTPFEQAINDTLGVLCLTKHPKQLPMWSHYAANHNGIAVAFDRNSEFFKAKEVKEEDIEATEILRDVEYIDERISISTKDRKVVIAGKFTKDMNLKEKTQLFFRKHPDWHYEDEVRLLVPLQRADEIRDRIHLVKIPHEAIKELALGARIKSDEARQIGRKIQGKRNGSTFAYFMHA